MKVELMGHNCLYQVEQLAQSLFGIDSPGTAISAVHRAPKTIFFCTKIKIGDQVHVGSRRLAVKDDASSTFYRCLRQSFFDAALPYLSEFPAWGAIAGVRPTKISTKHLCEGGTAESADALLEKDYYVSAERRKLAITCSQATVDATNKTERQDISIYIGIPFCPTRCSYCSFVSSAIGKKKKLLDEYLEALLQEIAVTGKLLRESDRTVRTLYIGGGTPTTLSAAQLQKLLEAIRTHIDLNRCIEFTVEAGRPDTLTPEKLQIIRESGADRISINPQTMNDDVLAACGRPHTAQDVYRVYQQALEAKLADINMDLIAGLPGDTYESFCAGLDALIALNPSNITVHTLALKKGADLFENRQNLPSREDVSRMLDYSREKLEQAGYRPYYLYRQKYMTGNFENIGWSRDQRDCLYNIYMMEEIHPIVSLGGGGMSKVPLPRNKLARFNNPKIPEQYLQQFDRVLAQKEEIFRLLSIG